MKNLPALLGNSPIFENSIPFAKPVLPEFQGFANDLEPIFASGILTKGSQLHRFEQMIWSNMESSIVGDICLAIERAHEFAPEIRERLTSPGLALMS